MLTKFIIMLLPWKLKRFLLNKLFGFELNKDAHIGISWIYPSHLKMSAGSKIGHLNVAIHLDEMDMNEYATISKQNWITGFTTKVNSVHFNHQKGRHSKLTMRASSAITAKHHIDCTSEIVIGEYSTVAGYQSQLLTHSINILDNIQDSAPIYIGDYCFIGTNVTILGGTRLPSKSVLGAKSLLNKSFVEEWSLYAGVPARYVKPLDKQAKYFSRSVGFVN